MSESKASRPKWEVTDRSICEWRSPFREVCRFHDAEFSSEDSVKHATLIVRAVNSHDDLVAALKELIGVLDAHNAISYDCDRSGEKYCDCLDRVIKPARKAIAAAEGRPE